MSNDFNNNPKKNEQHTYFLTSTQTSKFCVSKLHFCSWLYANGEQCLEIGAQCQLPNLTQDIAVDKELQCRPLTIDFWIPWLTKTDEIEDLYPSIAKKENAAFIFNDACSKAGDCIEWKKNVGQVLEFTQRGRLTVVPLRITPDEGKAKVVVLIPEEGVKGDVYFRFCVKITGNRFTTRRKEVSKDVYAFNINYGLLRNQPDSLRCDDLCRVGDVFCIHIVPGGYLQTFLDPGTFRNMRFLETERYCRFAAESKVMKQCDATQPMVVSFNKSVADVKSRGGRGVKFSSNRTCSFFSLFEQDCIGPGQTKVNICINVICSLVCAAIVAVIGWLSASLNKGSRGSAEPVKNEMSSASENQGD